MIGVCAAGFAAGAPPRLAVVISVDQCRGDYLRRFEPHMAEGGFRRLMSEGAVYEQCHHRHATTNTANGHATLMTGVHAEVHGVIGNEWLLRETLEKVGSVSDPEYPVVGAIPSNVRTATGFVEGKLGASPHRLLVPTIADQLKIRHGGSSRVVSIAGKNRVAILMAGRRGDGAYWVDGGRVVTSRFYRDALPAWVESFNATQPVDKDYGRVWTRLIDEQHYVAVQGLDDATGEESPHGLGRVFPHPVDGGKPQGSNAFYEAHRISPFSSVVLGELAKAAIRGEELGRHSAPDLLCIGFSQPDSCGHSYGPDSHEIMDSILRLDRVVADLLRFLDTEVGAGKYTVVVSSDHGVAPLPERGGETGGGVRVEGAGFTRAVETALTEEFGRPADGAYWVVRDGSSIRFRRETLESLKVGAERAEAVAKAALLRHPQIAAAFTRTELMAMRKDGADVAAAVRRGFNAERSGDVLYVLRPRAIDRMGGGSTHGTPHAYDTHVPLVWFGAGVPRGVHAARVGTDQVAATLCALLGISPPPQTRAERLF